MFKLIRIKKNFRCWDVPDHVKAVTVLCVYPVCTSPDDPHQIICDVLLHTFDGAVRGNWSSLQDDIANGVWSVVF
jgi:hypothetical protein